MRVYLDVSCLNRPFDDQSQTRGRLEAEAVRLIVERCDRGEWTDVSSDMAAREVEANPDPAKRDRARELLPDRSAIMSLTTAQADRAAVLVRLGFKPADALHVAAAEALGVDVLLTCDDQLVRSAARNRAVLRVRVANPVDWLK
jgi:predicted nucleic acid-binding protein